jgi:hypothetical protein
MHGMWFSIPECPISSQQLGVQRVAIYRTGGDGTNTTTAVDWANAPHCDDSSHSPPVLIGLTTSRSGFRVHQRPQIPVIWPNGQAHTLAMPCIPTRNPTNRKQSERAGYWPGACGRRAVRKASGSCASISDVTSTTSSSTRAGRSTAGSGQRRGLMREHSVFVSAWRRTYRSSAGGEAGQRAVPARSSITSPNPKVGRKGHAVTFR